jgi:hypothetical protein
MTKVRRGKGGFSLVMTIFIGIILTGAALAIVYRSSNEVQISTAQSGSVSALNAAESAGASALQELLTRANSVSFASTLSSDNFLPYLCKNTPDWALVEKASGTMISAASVVTEDSSNSSKDYPAQTFDPLLLATNQNLSGAITDPKDLGLVNLTLNSCTGIDPTTASGGRAFLPGSAAGPGLSWTATQIDPGPGPMAGGLEISRAKKIGNSGSNEVWSRAVLKNFKLNVVEAIAGADPANAATFNKPTGVFRLIYTFDIVAEGTIRTAGGAVTGRQLVQAPNLLVIDIRQKTQGNSNFSQYSFFIDDSDVCYGTNQIITGRAHVNKDICFFNPAPDETKIEFTDEFTTAQCQFAGSCPYGVVGRPGAANFSGGAKFKEQGIGYIQKPDIGNYQLKAALFGQTIPSLNPENDTLKNSEIRTQIGINSSSTPPPVGVYWVNPTDRAASSTDPTTYSNWLAQATNKATNPNNTEDNLLPGIFIQGNVDYVNMYAAKSSGVSDPNLQIIEIQQTTAGETRKTRFSLNKEANTTAVEVASGTGAYGSPISYNKTFNGIIFIDGDVGDNTKACPSNNKNICRGVISIPGNDLPTGVTAPATLSVGPPSNLDSIKDTPTIQKDWGITLAANGDIAIQDNLDYQIDPRGADRKFGINPSTNSNDDPEVAEAKNALGIIAFDKRQYKNEDGTVASPIQVNGTIYWGQGLKDNVRLDRDPADSRDVDVVNVQASLYGYSETLNYENDRLAEYIQVLGSEIMTKAKGDYSFGCSSRITPPGGASFTTSLCSGSKVKIIGDKRFSNGTYAPPGFPTVAQTTTGPFPYDVKAVGKQSIGKVRWQTLEYQ